jgi:hypothetical protein
MREAVQSNSLAHRMGEGGRRAGEGMICVLRPPSPWPSPPGRGNGCCVLMVLRGTKVDVAVKNFRLGFYLGGERFSFSLGRRPG